MDNYDTQNAHHDAQYRRHSAQDTLYSVAESQAGYFTTSQAQDAGYSRPLLRYHARVENFDRVAHGVYRLKRFPSSPNEDLFVAWLKAGPRSVVSHESALALYGLSDVLPSQVHLTLPRTSSRRRPGIRMHTTSLSAEEIATRDGLPVTTVARTLVDVSRAGLSSELILQAIHEALERGMITLEELHARADSAGGRAGKLIRAATRDEEGRE